jgi:hypothetical protein
MLGKLSFADRYLTASANGSPATDGINVNAKRPGSLQYRSSRCKAATLAGRREDDEGV